MKIAIFHNYMDNIGGAERVTLTLARELVADIYTTVFDPEMIKKMGFSDVLDRIHAIGWVPKNPPFRQQIALFRFRYFKLKNKYDYFLICGDWAMSGAVKNKPNLWYVHSPIREIWDLYEHTRKTTVQPVLRPFFDLWVYINQFLNKKYISHVQKLICNSSNTQKRVKKYLGRDSIIIYPPINTEQFESKKYENYWLSVNRLISHKRIELQLKAFKKLPNEKLLIVGSYEKGAKHFESYQKKIQEMCPDNVKIRNWVNQDELIGLYSNCKGFIATAKDEDFGMTVVEAMAAGKPVIAVNEGGYCETVLDGITGKLITADVESIIDAVNGIGKNSERYKVQCVERSQVFDTKVFIKKIKEQLL